MTEIATLQAGQPIPGYDSKCKKSREPKIGRMEDPTFATPVREVHFEKAIAEL